MLWKSSGKNVQFVAASLNQLGVYCQIEKLNMFEFEFGVLGLNCVFLLRLHMNLNSRC